jgi:RNA polymerase sigma factor (sigma-70 family)
LESPNRLRIMDWVGSEILPHEADVRAWLRRSLDPNDLEDIIQSAYCRIASLDDVSHIRSGRAYLFTTARSLVLERIRRARIVSIETVTEIDALDVVRDEPSPERIAAGRRELARVKGLIEALPDRCRRIFELRKVEGLTQQEVAHELGVPEHTVENDVKKGLKLILKAIADGDMAAERILSNVEQNERARDSRSD